MKRILLLVVLSLIFAFTTTTAIAAGPTEEEPEIYPCWFTSQVINIDDFPGYDQYGNPEVMARVDFGYYYYNSRTRKYIGVSTFFVYADKDWTSTLRGAARSPVSVGTESDQECYSGPYRGWVTYVKSNPNATYDWYPDYGYGKE